MGAKPEWAGSNMNENKLHVTGKRTTWITIWELWSVTTYTDSWAVLKGLTVR